MNFMMGQFTLLKNSHPSLPMRLLPKLDEANLNLSFVVKAIWLSLDICIRPLQSDFSLHYFI